ncbi:MAG: 2-hydroxyacid dehydrogenase [Pseudomonadota bacterium]
MQVNILMCDDYMLRPWLSEVKELLEADGYSVTEGLTSPLTGKTFYCAERHLSLLKNADIILATNRSVFDRDAIVAARRLRGVVFPAIGTESFDLETANEIGIPVAHGPTSENYLSMAEATILLMLSLSYDLHGTEHVLRFSQPRPTVIRARMLLGKTVGLVGFGRIAKAVADRLVPWGVKILVYSPRQHDSANYPAVTFTDLKTVLSECDFLSIHTTLTAETRHLIGAEELALLKNTAFLVNTARGDIVDEQALFVALNEKRIAGAALDTFELEPLPKESPLRHLDNVILTPHMIGHTKEIYDVIPRTSYENIKRLISNQAPLYFKNPEVYPVWRARLRQLDKNFQGNFSIKGDIDGS